MYLLELTNASLHGLAAATFALMYALGGSAMALLGALHPFWRWNMVAMAGMALLTAVTIAVALPESPMWLVRKGRDSELDAAMGMIMGDEEYVQELGKMKLAYKKNMELAKESEEMGKIWSVPLAIIAGVVKREKKLPKPPLSFLFLVVLYIFMGWSGLTYVTLNGPKLFEVDCKCGVGRHSSLRISISSLFCRIRLEIWALTNTT